MLRRYRAAWILPVCQPPIENGVVVVDDNRIAAVGPADRLGFDEDLGDAALLPGLVNAHVHLDLTNLRGKLAPPGDDPTVWLEQVIAHRLSASEAETGAAIRHGVAETLTYGVSAVGDIDGTGSSSRLLPPTPLRGVAYCELIGVTTSGAEQARQRVARTLTACAPSTHLGLGLSPHAPYTVRRDLISWAVVQRLPIAIHLGEFWQEADFLATKAGPFQAFLARLGIEDISGLPGSWSEVLELTAPARPCLFAHGNYLPRELFSQLTNDTIVYCPRTHAYFSHAPHPFREMLAAGINVALGTDGLSSNPDLSLFKEMQFLHKRYGDQLSGHALLEMGTRNGARALGIGAETGTLAPKKEADLLALSLDKTTGADPYRLLFESSGWVSRLLIAGAEVVRDGQARLNSPES